MDSRFYPFLRAPGPNRGPVLFCSLQLLTLGEGTCVPVLCLLSLGSFLHLAFQCCPHTPASCGHCNLSSCGYFCSSTRRFACLRVAQHGSQVLEGVIASGQLAQLQGGHPYSIL